MELFYIDKGNLSSNSNDESKKFVNTCENIENLNSLLKNVQNDLRHDLLHNLPNLQSSQKLEKKTKQTSLKLSETYVINGHTKPRRKKYYFSNDCTVTTTGLEKEYSIPTFRKRILKLKQKKFTEKTKGQKWFNIPATEITDNIKTDFQVLKMRAVLDKNQMYKKNNLKHISKYFQVGTIVENPADFYNGRIPKSLRRKTIVEELLADAECRNYQKMKYKEIINTNIRKRMKNSQGF